MMNNQQEFLPLSARDSITTHDKDWLVQQLREADEIPDVRRFLYQTYLSTYEFTYQWNKYPINWTFIWNTLVYAVVQFYDLATIIGLAVGFTVLRYVLSKYVIIPYCKKIRMNEADIQKFPEALWRFFIYVIMWSISVYYVFFSGEVDYFHSPCNMWRDVYFDPKTGYLNIEVPFGASVIYFLQSSFYLHSTFATLYMDYVRSDYIAMLMHHAITSTLLTFSYFMKYYKIGVLVLLVHDVTDILMEFAKLNVYLKHRNGKVYQYHETIANVTFAIFTLCWAYFRLYLYPMKVLHSCTWCIYLLHKDKDPRMYNLFNTLLFVLQGIHIYWFYHIMRIVMKIVTGKMKEIDDIREEEISETKDQSDGVPSKTVKRKENGVSPHTPLHTSTPKGDDSLTTHRKKSSNVKVKANGHAK